VLAMLFALTARGGSRSRKSSAAASLKSFGEDVSRLFDEHKAIFMLAAFLAGLFFATGRRAK